MEERLKHSAILAIVEIENVDSITNGIDDVELIGNMIDGNGTRSPNQGTVLNEELLFKGLERFSVERPGVNASGRQVAPIHAVPDDMVVYASNILCSLDHPAN
jgi:hypothetical protein